MCGICGYRAAGEGGVSRELLQRMNETLRHRGPDGEGFFAQGRVGMAMRRLAIIDVAGGAQPILNEDRTIALVFNGEIYNFQELRCELERVGHRFATVSDTETIVHAYEEWGDQALVRFNGMFALALWDSHQHRLLLARDRMGKKPLYWHASSHGLLFGSEIKSLLAAPWVKRSVNREALHHYLTLQYTPDPLTMFEGIYQLPAAHKLVIEGDNEPKIERWWQLEFEPKWNITEHEAVETARALLDAAVQRRLISEVPLGAFLSGGMDSSTIVALMAEHSTKPVKTFSIGFDEARYSETHYARMVAERYATEHHEFIFRPANLASVAEHVLRACDSPLGDLATLPLYELSRETRAHVTVAVCGDGGDETLAGYQRYAYDSILQRYSLLPEWLTQRAVPAMLSRIPELYGIPEDRNPITALKRLGQFSAVTHKASLVRWGSYFGHAEKLALYADDLRPSMGDLDSADTLARAYDAAQASSLLDRTLYTDHVTYLVGALLPKTDRMTMAHSVEARSPFLDKDWVEWTARLPEHYKVRGRATKWLLARAFADKLPDEIVSRGKHGFSVPVGMWLTGELREWARERLGGNRALDAWFKPSVVKCYFDEHQSGRVNHGKRLWALLMFALWQERYL